jgi:membrane protease YdiL (CAAX protease family)
MLKKLITNTYFFFGELTFLALITHNENFFFHQNYQIRIVIYVISLFYLIFVIKLIGFSQKQLGLTKKDFLPSLKSIAPIIVLFILILPIIRLFYPSLFGLSLHPDSIWLILLRGFYYSIISAPVQELIFRAYVVNRLEQFSLNRHFLIVVSSLIFALAHWPFGSFPMVISTFVLGILLSVNFLKYRNIFTPIIVHSLVGLALMLCILQ